MNGMVEGLNDFEIEGGLIGVLVGVVVGVTVGVAVGVLVGVNVGPAHVPWQNPSGPVAA
jgi:hypothetical protein